MVVVDSAAKPRKRDLVRIVQLSKQPAEAVFGLFNAVALHGSRAVDQYLDRDRVLFFKASWTVHTASQYRSFSWASRVMSCDCEVHVAKTVNNQDEVTIQPRCALQLQAALIALTAQLDFMAGAVNRALAQVLRQFKIQKQPMLGLWIGFNLLVQLQARRRSITVSRRNSRGQAESNCAIFGFQDLSVVKFNDHLIPSLYVADIGRVQVFT